MHIVVVFACELEYKIVCNVFVFQPRIYKLYHKLERYGIYILLQDVGCDDTVKSVDQTESESQDREGSSQDREGAGGCEILRSDR